MKDEINLLSAAHQVWARKGLLALYILTFLVIGVFISVSFPDEYTAISTVQMEKKASNLGLTLDMLDVGSSVDGSSTVLETEFHVIKSSLVLGEVVKKLDRNVVIEPKRVPLISTILIKSSDVFSGNEFLLGLTKKFPKIFVLNDAAINASNVFLTKSSYGSVYKVNVLDEKRYRIKSTSSEGDSLEKEAKFGEPIHLFGLLDLVLHANGVSSGDEFSITIVPTKDAVEKLARNLKISERMSGRTGTGIVDFKYTSFDPQEASLIVNTVISEYQRQSLSRKSAEIDQSIAFIEEQLPVAEDTLAKALEAKNNYMREVNSYSDLSVLTQEVMNQVVELETRLADLEFKKRQLVIQFTVNHPEYQRLAAEESELNKRLEKMKVDLGNVPSTEQKMAQLSKNVQSAQQIREQLISRLDQLKIARAGTVGTTLVLDKAEVSEKSGPNRLKPVAISTLLGASLCVFWVLSTNMMRKGIEDARMIEAKGLSVFATIPLVSELKSKGARDSIYALVKEKPDDLASEALRGLRTGLQFALAINGAKSVALTSTAPSEGKSFISLNLASVAGAAGSKVLLVDADMRRGELHKYFKLAKSEKGLASVLSKTASVTEVIRHSNDLNIDYIINGGYPPNPSELLASPTFASFLEYVEKNYDLVIFDCPPVLAVTDPVIVGSKVGATFMVVTHLKTTEMELESAVANLNSAGVKLSGVIINSYDVSGGRYGSLSVKYGYYRSAYHYKYDRKN